MKKQFSLLAALVLSVGQAFADQVSFTSAALYATLPSSNTKVDLPYTWEAAPYRVTVALAKEGTATQSVAASQMSLSKGTELTVSLPGGTIDAITLTTSSANPVKNFSASVGSYTTESGSVNGTWTPDGGSYSSVTFTLTGTAPLKGITVDYTPGDVVAPLDYVYYNGARRENCFATDIIPVTSTQIRMGFNVESKDGWAALFSGRNVGAGTGISLYKNGNNVNLGYFTGGTTGAGDGFAPLTCGQDYDIIADVTKLQWSTDGGENWESKETGNSVTNETSRVLTFFANPENDVAVKGKVYYFAIYDGEDLIRNYTPAISHDGMIGFWENVNGQFIQPREGSQDGYSAGFSADGYYLKGCTSSLSIPADQKAKIELEQQGEPSSVKYYSANSKIASVAEDGTVSGLSVGKTVVYVVIDEPNGRWNQEVEVEVTGAAKNQYNFVDYIYFDGSNDNYTNYFETGYLPKYNTVIDLQCKAYEKSKGSWRAVFSGRDNTSNGMSLYMNGSGNDWGYFVSGNNEDWAGTFAVGTDYTVNFTKDALTVNGEVTKTKSGITEDNFKSGDHTISIFSGANDWPFYGEISYFKISEGDEVIHEYVPAVRHDGAACLYDKVTEEYITPKGSGFYAGIKDGSGNSMVSLEENTITVFTGFTASAKPTFAGCSADNYTISYASADESIVSVSEEGELLGVSLGSTTVTISIAAKESEEVWIYDATVNVESPTIAVENVEAWDGQSGIILGSIKRSGDDYKYAYTTTFDSGMGYNGDYFNYVWGEPAEDASMNPWYAANYVMTSKKEALWSYNNSTLPNNWPSNMGEVYVRRYFTTAVGAELPETLYMAAPHDDAPCEYYINGTLVWNRTGYEPGVDGWYEDEIVKLSDEQKNLIKTDGSVNVFAYHVHQNYGGRYADGGLYGTGTDVANAFENNENLKRLSLAVAQAEEVEGFDADILTYAQNATVCMQDVNYALKLVRYNLKNLIGVHYDFSGLESVEPADGAQVWIYNVGAGLFLGGNNDWGTHASLTQNISAWPMVLRTNTSGANRYCIQTNLPNGTRGTNDWLGHNGYVDCGTPGFDNVDWAWEFEATGNGTYRIINSQNSGSNIYLGMTEDYRYQVDTDKSGADNIYNQWKLFTLEQFEALLDEASETNPVDVSYLIHQNTFSQNDFDGNNKNDANADLNDSKWERTAGSIWNWKGNDADGDYCFEAWNVSDELKLSQTITGLREGKYVVSCQAYYRDGNYGSAIGGNARQLASLYANGSDNNSALVPSILDAANMGAGYGNLSNLDTVIPDGCKDAAKFFQYGEYAVSVEVNVDENGTLEFGIVRPADGILAEDWLVADNFRLFYLGDNATGIAAPAQDSEVAEGALIYNLAGQRLNKAQKGVNIVGGKAILK